MLSWRRRCFLLGGERQRRGSKLNPTGPNGPAHVEALPAQQVVFIFVGQLIM